MNPDSDLLTRTHPVSKKLIDDERAIGAAPQPAPGKPAPQPVVGFTLTPPPAAATKTASPPGGVVGWLAVDLSDRANLGFSFGASLKIPEGAHHVLMAATRGEARAALKKLLGKSGARLASCWRLERAAGLPCLPAEPAS